MRSQMGEKERNYIGSFASVGTGAAKTAFIMLNKLKQRWKLVCLGLIPSTDVAWISN